MAIVMVANRPYTLLCSVAAADGALALTTLAAAWGAKEEADKIAALYQATELVRSFPKWADIPADTPRVAIAAARIAATQDFTATAPATGVSSLSAGAVSMNFVSGRPDADAVIVDAIARRILDSLSSGTGTPTVSQVEEPPTTRI